MIEVDRGDGGGRGVDGIGGVQPSAESHFEDRDVDLGVAERLQRERRRRFEKGRRRGQPLGEPANPPSEVLQVVAADRPAVDRDPFGQADQMR